MLRRASTFEKTSLACSVLGDHSCACLVAPELPNLELINSSLVFTMNLELSGDESPDVSVQSATRGRSSEVGLIHVKSLQAAFSCHNRLRLLATSGDTSQEVSPSVQVVSAVVDASEDAVV